MCAISHSQTLPRGSSPLAGLLCYWDTITHRTVQWLCFLSQTGLAAVTSRSASLAVCGLAGVLVCKRWSLYRCHGFWICFERIKLDGSSQAKTVLQDQQLDLQTQSSASRRYTSRQCHEALSLLLTRILPHMSVWGLKPAGCGLTAQPSWSAGPKKTPVLLSRMCNASYCHTLPVHKLLRVQKYVYSVQRVLLPHTVTRRICKS